MPDPDDLPTEVLLRLARREVAEGDSETPMPSLVALQGRPVREVFDRAAPLLQDNDPVRRELGVLILRELGPAQHDGYRPFRRETVPLLRSMIRGEPDSGVLRWVVSALGYHQAGEALPEVLALAGHSDSRVRFHVAAALPGLVGLADVPADAGDTLIRLCRDDDADTRYYALYAATREIPGLDSNAMSRLTAELRTDPDEQVRAMAGAHHTAVEHVRGLLGDPRQKVIGSLLVALAQDAEVDEIRDQFGMTPEASERLHAWWQEHDRAQWS